MRDSWIDKKELDELVGGFASSKGKSRRRGSPALESAGEIDPGLRESAASVKSSKTDLPESEMIRSEPVVEIKLISGADDPFGGEEIDSEGGGRAGVEVHAGVPYSEIASKRIPEEYFTLDELEPSDSGKSEAGYEAFELLEDTPFSDTRLMDLTETGMGPDPEQGEIFEPGMSMMTPSGGVISNLVEEDAAQGGHSPRKIPTFFGGTSESPESRQLPISIRDADRAYTALAEARAKVDESGLLSIPLYDRAEATRYGIEAEAASEQSHVDPVPEVIASEQIGIYSGKNLRERLENFGDVIQRELGSSEVAVCDEEGLLLYKSASLGDENSLLSALLFHVSGRINALIGVGREGVSQLTDGGGLWRCLISGAGGQGILFAGFTLREPLGQDEIEFWQKALVETSVSSSPRH